MNNKDIEKLLRAQKDNFVPDIRQKIDDIKNMNIERVPVRAKQKPRINTFYKVALAAFALVLVAIPMFFLMSDKPIQNVHALYIDVNPSLKLEINDREKVVDALFLNNDAAALFDKREIKGKDLSKAFEIILEKLNAANYLDNENGEIILSMKDTEDSGLISKYNSYFKEQLAHYSNTIKVTDNTLTDGDLQKIEQDDNLTAGKIKYINEISDLTKGENLDDLNKMELEKLRKIKQILEKDDTSTLDSLKNLTDRELDEKYDKEVKDTVSDSNLEKGNDDDNKGKDDKNTDNNRK